MLQVDLKGLLLLCHCKDYSTLKIKTMSKLLNTIITFLVMASLLQACDSTVSNSSNAHHLNSATMTKETYVLIHSAWLGAWQWDAVKKEMEAAGHTVITPDLPGHGADQTAPKDITMEDYVQTILDVLEQQSKPVILVGHSFNGITISRVAELVPNKIKSLVYLTAFMVPNGVSFVDAAQGVTTSKAVENFYLSEDKTYALVKEEAIQAAFAHDIPKAAFDAAKPYIVPEPAAPLMYPLEITSENWGKLPKYYIECTEDRAIPIDIQRAMYKGKVEKVFTLETSHTPNFSNPSGLAKILISLN